MGGNGGSDGNSTSNGASDGASDGQQRAAKVAATAPAMAAVMAAAVAGVTAAVNFLRYFGVVSDRCQTVSHPSREIVMDGVLIFFSHHCVARQAILNTYSQMQS